MENEGRLRVKLLRQRERILDYIFFKKPWADFLWVIGFPEADDQSKDYVTEAEKSFFPEISA